MSRIIPQLFAPGELARPGLPVVNWAKSGKQAPQIIPFNYGGEKASLPAADVAVITWTDDEWSALDHVFLNSSTTRDHYNTDWRSNWRAYAKGTLPAGLTVWGSYQLVSIKNGAGATVKVLLFKSECHLAHPPYINGLADMVKAIVSDSGVKKVFSIGTAGGSIISENLGDVVVTNAAHIQLQKSENTVVNYNNQTFTSANWVDLPGLSTTVEKQLFYALSNIVNNAFLNQLLTKLHKENASSQSYTLGDLVNQPVSPANLGSPKNIPRKNVPLLTTDFYYISPNATTSPYCVLEMDDAVIAHQAQAMNANFEFVRNISDALVADKAANGTAIPNPVREAWSSLIYSACGLYTSFNGALTAWSIIAG